MWLFTKVGFFSISEPREEPGRIQVRARVEGDLESLRNKYLPELTETVRLQGRDYPYRGYCSKPELSKAVAKIAMDIDYSNFKNEVEKTQGRPREEVYAQVWRVMYNAERTLEDTPKIPVQGLYRNRKRPKARKRG